MRRLSMVLLGAGLVLVGSLLGTSGALAPQAARAEAEAKKEEPASEAPVEAKEGAKPEEKGGEEKPAEEKATEQPTAARGPSRETLEKIKRAYDALKEAADALEKEQYYAAATNEVNVFGVLSGGVNAIGDLESGNGVDPETFAAIYAGTIKPEVQELLQRDSSNRYTYNGKLVQMYPVSELRRRFLIRAQLTGQITPEQLQGGSAKPAASEEKPAEKK